MGHCGKGARSSSQGITDHVAAVHFQMVKSTYNGVECVKERQDFRVFSFEASIAEKRFFSLVLR